MVRTTTGDEGRWQAGVFALCAIASLAPLWSVKYVPMTDLPHHAAQVAIWARYDDPRFAFREHFTLNWSSPYLLGYAIARGFAVAFAIPTALKLTVSTIIVAVPAALLRLMRATEGDRCWALLGFPLAYGTAFYWGLLNFLVAIPLGILLIAEGFRYSVQPTRRAAVALGALAVATYLAHALVFALASTIVALLVVSRASNARLAVTRVLPLGLPLAPLAVWVASAARSPVIQGAPTIWDPSAWRVVEAAALVGPVYGDGRGWFAAGLLVVLAASARWRREWRAYVPLGVAGGVYLLAPRFFFHTGLFNERFAAFLIPSTLVALAPARRGIAGREAFRWALCAALVLGTAGGLVVQFRAFDAEAREFDAILDRMEPSRSVVSLPLANESRHVRGSPYAHFAGWYQAEKGGVLADSFANLPPVVARLKEQRPPRYLDDVPARFDAAVDGAWDYYLVRARGDPTRWLEQRTRAAVVLERSAGDWHLYRLRERSVHARGQSPRD